MVIQDLTFGQLIGALVVFLVLIGVYNTIMSAIKTWREEKKLRNSPITQLKERVDRHDELLSKDR